VTPPFAVAVGLLAIGTGLAAWAGSTALVVALLGGLALLALALVIGLLQGEASARTWMSLLAAPWYVLWKLGVQVRAMTRLSRPQSVDVPTARGGRCGPASASSATGTASRRARGRARRGTSAATCASSSTSSTWG